MKVNRKIKIVDGIKFDSTKEANRYIELKGMLERGEISKLQRQVKFELTPPIKGDGWKERGSYYVADFTYIQDGVPVVEDVKGLKKGSIYRTFVLKRKMMAYRYGIHVIET